MPGGRRGAVTVVAAQVGFKMGDAGGIERAALGRAMHAHSQTVNEQQGESHRGDENGYRRRVPARDEPHSHDNTTDTAAMSTIASSRIPSHRKPPPSGSALRPRLCQRPDSPFFPPQPKLRTEWKPIPITTARET